LMAALSAHERSRRWSRSGLTKRSRKMTSSSWMWCLLMTASWRAWS
jgi:hypothetical protein